MAVPFSNTKLRVPKGFQNILECLAREVLRTQPDNIHEFAAAYFESLLKIRTETGHDPAVHGAKLDDRNYNNESYKKKPSDPQEAQQKVAAATTVQTQFRQQLAKDEVKVMRDEDAAIKIQSAFRGHVDREKVRELRESEPATKSGDDDNDDVADIDLNDPELEKAAIKLQAGFKGFKARKQMTAPIQDQTVEEDAAVTQDKQDVDLGTHMDRGVDPTAHDAASKIQAGFRGFKTRQGLKDQEDAAGSQDKQDVDLGTHMDRGMDPTAHDAASKIQAGFRGFKTRQGLKDQKTDTTPEEETDDNFRTDHEADEAATKIQAGFRGYRARQEIKTKQTTEGDTEEDETDDSKKEDDLVNDDMKESRRNEAAMKIQAGFRGLKSRQELHMKKELREKDETERQAKEEEEEEAVDIDLTDPELEKAAMKIQAGFKGLRARKEMKKFEDQQQDEETTAHHDGGSTPHDIQDVADGESETEKAACKIQAGYRGYVTRKTLKQSSEQRATIEEEDDNDHDDDENNFDLTNPEIEQATIKIQAGFKGYKARKEMQAKMEDIKGKQNENNDYEFNDEEQQRNKTSPTEEDDGEEAHVRGNVDREVAATKIQAGFKGMQARRKVKDLQESKRQSEHAAADDDEEEEPDEM